MTTQRTRFEAGLADKSALTSATVQASELDTQIEGAHRAYLDAQLELASAMGIDPAKASLPEPEGELQSVPMRVDLDSETAAALQRRADLKLARLFVRAANEDQRIIAADYYPVVIGSIPGEYVPVTGIHREGSTSRNQDFIGSEIRERAAYTWRVIDNGKVGGAVLRARSAREINELTCRKLEANIPRELSRIANDLKTTEVREKSLVSAATAAEESAHAVQENVASGLASPLEYRVTQNFFSGDQERTVRGHLSTQSRCGRVGPRHWALFSIFGRHAEIALDTASEQDARRVVARAELPARWASRWR